MKSPVFKTLAWLALAFSLSFAACSLHNHPRLSLVPPLQRGDMIFLDLDCGPICDAIEDVTLEQFKVKGPRLSHVAVMLSESDAIEAWPEGGVRVVSLNELVSRSDGLYFGILKPEYRSLGEEAASRMEAFLDLPYNDSFDWKQDRFYCSELVSFGYADLTRGLTQKRGGLFAPRPMYFGKKTSNVYQVWSDYFKDLGVEMPENQPGVSPLGIYLEGQKSLFQKP